MTSDLNRPLPDSLESEKMLIASIWDDGSKLLEAIPLVNESDFSQDALRECWRWFLELHDRNQRISPYAMKQWFGAKPHYATVTDLLSSADGVVPGMVRDYAGNMAQRARLRSAVVSIARLHATAEKCLSFEDLRGRIEALFLDSCGEAGSKGFRPMKAIVADLRDRLANPVMEPRHRTGFPSLDRMLKGGLRAGQLVIIAGRTGGGKTVLAMNFLVQFARDEIPCGVFSLEMNERDLAMRCILSEGVRHGEEAAFSIVENLPIHVDDSSNVTVKSIVARMKLLNLRQGVKVFVVDYLQLIGDDAGSRESRERIVAGMSRALKVAAKDLGVVVIALSQLNEAGELRESRAIEQDADAVIYVLDNGEDWFLRLCKQRGGESHGPQKRIKKDEAPGIPIRFHRENFRFAES